MGEDPEEEGKYRAEHEAGDDWEVKSGMFAAMDDVAGKFTEAEGEFGAEVEKSADEYEDDAEQEKSAAEVTERIHKSSIEEAAHRPRAVREFPFHYLLIDYNRY
jgi:hypothetical protein